ncbi:MAG: hypothetical protein JSR83_09150 [Proteobacteria bacterium]|nr:hypothetical protein [Pseudomonadota bacterium]
MVFNWRHVVLAILFVVGSVGAWSLRNSGYADGRRDCALDQAAASNAAAARARASAEAQSQRDLAAAKADAAARIDQLRRRNALEADIKRNPGPADCGLDGPAAQLLNDTIRAGNSGAAAATPGVHEDLPAGTGADGRKPSRVSAVGE